MMSRYISYVIRFFSSLYLTVIGLILATCLIFFATLAQVNIGLYWVKKVYLESWFLWWNPAEHLFLPVFPGGKLLGWVLLINLLVAHFTRFKWSLKKMGIWLTHLGLIVLLVGGGLSAMLSKEYQLPLSIGETRNYLQQMDVWELAVESDQDAQNQKVVSIPTSYLSPGEKISVPALPFQFKVLEYYPNTRLKMGNNQVANRGIGLQVSAQDAPINRKEFAQNVPSAYVECFYQGKSLGVWLLSSGLGMPQSVAIKDRLYTFSIRPKRVYLSYRVTLKQFIHEVYPGTNVPKRFVSKVHITEQNGSVSDHLIYMNNPLRIHGKTFYQASFANQDTMSIFQVVDNRVWLLPYVASALVFVGLLLHFSLSLWAYLKRWRSV
jgi:hypothetical protein